METVDVSAIIVLLILIIQTIWDVRHKEIPIAVTLVGIGLGVIMIFWNKRDILDVVSSLLLGGIFLLIARISKEAVGYGDGFLIFMMGLFYPLEFLLQVCGGAFVMAGGVALFLVIFFHKKGNYQIPFVPFLFFSNLICYLGG